MLDRNQLQAQGIHTIDTTPPLESQKLISLLKEHAPHAFSNGKLNLKSLANLLGIESSDNHYALSLLGKQEANALYNSPATKELKSEPDRSSEFNTTGNAIIIGDNLHALKTLKSAYYGKVKMIYIDPPYNTGSDGFIYRDHFDADYRKILQEKGFIQTDEEGKEILSEALNFCQNQAGDKSHSGWLSFMYPRLRLAQDLLRDDGVIFISIDDNEQANLKILCDEIFGEHNFISCFIWQKKSGGGQAKFFYEGHEYVLIYAKNKNELDGLFRIKEEKGGINKDIVRKIHGKYTNNETIKQIQKKYPNDIIQHRNLMFEELDIFLEEKIISQKKYDEIHKKIANQEYFLIPYADTKFNLICSKTENNLVKMYSILSGYWTADGNSEVENMFGGLVFDSPKPTQMLKDIIHANTKPDDIILDFFAGSGTTAHAVMELNAEDKNNGKQGNRKFILVQLDEAIDEKANKVAYDFCKSLGSENPTIADITIERVKRAGEKIREKGGDSAIDTGFKVFSLIDKQALAPQDQDLLTLASSPLTPYQKAINLALHAGKTLDTRIQPVIEDKLYRDERNFYLIACDKEVQKHLASHKNEEIFLSGYEDIAIQDLLNIKPRLKVLF